MKTIADTNITDLETGEVIAREGETLDAETLHRLGLTGIEQPTNQGPLPCPFCGGDMTGPGHSYEGGGIRCEVA